MTDQEGGVLGTLTIAGPQKYRREYETACNYDDFTLLPGTYEIQRYSGNYDTYTVAYVKATHDARYMLSRLFTASSLDTRTQDGVMDVGLYYFGTDPKGWVERYQRLGLVQEGGASNG